MTAVKDLTYRQTKIIATLGPSTSSRESIEGLIDAGVDLVRLNFSHGNKDSHVERAKLVRKIAKEKHYHVGIVGDLQGPKIRITRFINSKIDLKNDDEFTIDSKHPYDKGTNEIVGTTYNNLHKELDVDDILLLDDGRIELKVEKISNSKIISKVIHGGLLYDSKGLNRKGGGLSASAISDKDINDIKIAAEIGVDYLAVSFAREAKDIDMARKLLKEAGNDGGIIAKIERAEALKNIDEIIEASNAIMIARGDLGVEIGDAQLPAVQKDLIRKARKRDKVVITATQMMESMITNSIPTRAEVFDVANAVIDGTDAVMLSSETAMGDHPVEAVEAMSRICEGSEGQNPITSKGSNYSIENKKVDRAIAMACMLTADNLNPIAIAAITESGSTALWMSRINHSVPIFALTTHTGTLRKVTLYRGVYPARIKTIDTNHATVNKDAINVLTKMHVAKENDLVIITKGDLAGIEGGTNAIKVVKVGHLAEG
jgi:pyruvate kinase